MTIVIINPEEKIQAPSSAKPPLYLGVQPIQGAAGDDLGAGLLSVGARWGKN
jgi:hypothetical protein